MDTARVGQIEVTRIVEIEGANSPRFTEFMFPGLTPEHLAPQQDWLAPHFADPESGRLVMSIHTFVVRTAHHTILVDTCVGNDKPREAPFWHMREGPFLEDLGRAGVRPEDVDFVLCTHLHIDHVGWNTRLVGGQWVPTFPNAEYLFSQDEWDYWSRQTEGEDARVMDDSVRPIIEADLAHLVSGEHAIEDGVVLLPTPGHTPGHVSLRLESGGDKAVITGDMLHHPFQCANPEITSSYCVNPDQSRATRRAFLEAHAESGIAILGTHFATPTIGRIERRGDVWKLDVGG